MRRAVAVVSPLRARRWSHQLSSAARSRRTCRAFRSSSVLLYFLRSTVSASRFDLTLRMQAHWADTNASSLQRRPGRGVLSNGDTRRSAPRLQLLVLQELFPVLHKGARLLVVRHVAGTASLATEDPLLLLQHEHAGASTPSGDVSVCRE